MTWNVNQPDRWRHPDLVGGLKESDVDWNRFLINKKKIPFDPRIYIEYRLFWPYSSGIPGQWMSHQIDTVHWFSGFDHPSNVGFPGYWHARGYGLFGINPLGQKIFSEGKEELNYKLPKG